MTQDLKKIGWQLLTSFITIEMQQNTSTVNLMTFKK
jgi:hypothetical protein